MCKVIAIANQKGGVAKSVTTAQLGAALSNRGKIVLIIDANILQKCFATFAKRALQKTLWR